jgi:hypothetical protein
LGFWWFFLSDHVLQLLLVYEPQSFKLNNSSSSNMMMMMTMMGLGFKVYLHRHHHHYQVFDQTKLGYKFVCQDAKNC